MKATTPSSGGFHSPLSCGPRFPVRRRGLRAPRPVRSLSPCAAIGVSARQPCRSASSCPPDRARRRRPSSGLILSYSPSKTAASTAFRDRQPSRLEASRRSKPTVDASDQSGRVGLHGGLARRRSPAPGILPPQKAGGREPARQDPAASGERQCAAVPSPRAPEAASCRRPSSSRSPRGRARAAGTCSASP